MSSVQQRKTFVDYKLNFLTDQKAHLFSAVNAYVDKVVAEGNSWAVTTENRKEFTDLCLQIDKAVDYIYVKCEEISDATGSVNTSQHSQTWSDVTPESSQSLLSLTETTPPLIQTSTTSQTADVTVLHKVLARIDAMQEVICSVQRNAKEVGEKQGEHDSQITDMLSKMPKSDKKLNIRFNEVKEQITNLDENLTKVTREQKLRFQSLEKQLQKLSDKQKKLDDETRSCTQQMERQIADVTCEVEPVKDKINELNFLIDSYMSECSGRIKSAEKLAIEVTDKVTTNSELLETLSGNVMDNSNTLETLSDKVMTSSATLGNLSQKVTSNTETLANLSEKVTSSTETLVNLSEKVTSSTHRLETLCLTQEQNKSSLREFEAKLVETGAASEAEVSKIRIQVVDIDTKLSEVKSVVTKEVVPRLNLLEAHSSRQKNGFTASMQLDKRTDKDVPISSDFTVYTNVGGHFNSFTGMFTVPIDGLYVVSLFLLTYANGMYPVGIKRRPGGSDPKGDVLLCSVWTEVKSTMAGNLRVCELKAGDVVFLCSLEYPATNSSLYMNFSCFRLG